MGKFIVAPTRIVRPLQTEFCPEKFWPLLEVWRAGLEERILPPVVRAAGNRLLTLDGHHRLLAADLFGKDIRLYVVRNESDMFRYLLRYAGRKGSWETVEWTYRNFDGAGETARRLRETNWRSYVAWRNRLGITDIAMSREQVYNARY